MLSKPAPSNQPCCGHSAPPQAGLQVVLQNCPPVFSSCFVFSPFSLLAAVFLRAQRSLTSPCSAKTKRQSCKATAWPAKQGIFHICGQSLATCHLVYLARGADQATRGPSALKPAERLKLPRRRADGSERAQQQLSRLLRLLSQSLSSCLLRWSLQRVEANTFHLF